MTEATIKVLMHLSGKLDFENFTQQNQMDIAKAAKPDGHR